MPPVHGAKFWQFLADHGLSSADASRSLRVSRAAITSWKKKAPDGVRRRAIRIWTGGKVDESDWDTKEEREYLEAIRPHEAPRA